MIKPTIKEGLSVVPVSKLYDDATCQIYELLFCDDVQLFSAIEDVFPALFAKNPSKAELLKIAKDKKVESRVRILAYRRLKEINAVPAIQEILGVVVEYNQEIDDGKGLDTIAVYPDGNIRYINYTGKMAFAEGDVFIEQIGKKSFQDIFKLSKKITKEVAPYEKKRLPPPSSSNARITVLVNGDIYFIQKSADEMFSDELTGSILGDASMLLQFMMQQM